MLDIIAIPFGYLMRFCYTVTHNYALALILFTLFFKLILLPLNIKQHRSSCSQARIRPKERAIRKRYEGRTDQNAKTELTNDLLKLYQEEHVSMAGGCLPVLIQFPIILALYQIIQKPLSYLCMLATETVTAIQNEIFRLLGTGALNSGNTASAVVEMFSKAGGAAEKFSINQIQMVNVLRNNQELFTDFCASNNLSGLSLPDFTIFGGTIDLSQNPTFSLSILVIIPFLTALLQLASTLLIQHFGPKPDTSTPEAAATAKQMRIMNVVFLASTLFFSFQLPAIISFYWMYQSIFATVIQIALSKAFPIPIFTEADYAAAEAEMNKDYIPPKISSAPHHSLHHIDDDDLSDEGNYLSDNKEADAEDQSDQNQDRTTDEVSPPEETGNTPDEHVPPRRRYDKNGNKIRSLHYIDEDDDE